MSRDEKMEYVRRRAGAVIVDAVPIFVLIFFLWELVLPVGALSAGLLLSYPAWILARVLYHTPFEHYLGWTPGKRAFGLQVSAEDGGPPELLQAFIRNGLRGIDALAFYLVAVILVAVRSDGKRLGDLLSGTEVEMVAAPLLGGDVRSVDQQPSPQETRTVEDVLGEGEYEPPPTGPAPGGPPSPEPEYSAEPAAADGLSAYTEDLTEKAELGLIGPVIGRENEVRQVLRTFGRTTTNNPVLVGEAGVGKTAIAEGLARITSGIDGEPPSSLAGKRVLELDLTALEAGSTMRGMFEQRLQAVVEEARSRDDVILFLDELHRVMSAGGSSAGGASPAAQMLKPALSRGELSMMGATTLDEWRQIEKDPAMERRFQPVRVEPLSPADTTDVLCRVRGRWEDDGLVLVDEEVFERAPAWADKYLKGNLPYAAIRLIDDAASGRKMEGGGTVSLDDLADVIQEQTGIKVRASATDMEKLRTLESELRKRVVGQDHAARTVAMTIMRRAALGGGGRPASLLFFGPSGVGKTEMANALAAALYGDERRMVRIDMSEMQGEGSLNRLIGSPRGYIGSEEGGQLTEALRRDPSSVVLLDEIEKGHEKVYDVLLQLLGDGRLTDGIGRTVDAKHATVIMTTNVAAGRILAGDEDPATAVDELLDQGFRPEIVGRIDEKIVFRPLSKEDLQKIVSLEAERSLAGVRENRGTKVDLHHTLVSHIVEEGYDPRFGARELASTVRRRVGDYVTERILYGDFDGHEKVVLWYDQNGDRVGWFDPSSDQEEAQK